MKILEEPTEVEAKFTVADPTLLHKLATHEAVVAGYCFGDPITKELQDVYLDTADYRLLRHGYQLRVRAGDGQWLAALKSRVVASEVGIYHRLEIEEPLDEASRPAKVGALPAPIIDALSGIAGRHKELGVICTLEQTRQVREVSAASPGRKPEAASLLALLCLDEVRLYQIEEEAILARAYEVEIELAAGVDMAELQVLADRFMGAYGLIPSTESKLERALGIISRHPIDSPESWQGLSPAMHMGEACRIIWHEQFMVMLLNEAGVRYSSDPEYVHDARVAIRRARAAARIYQGYFKPKAVRGHLKRLRRTAQLLGAVRDMDVAIAKLEGYQQKTRKKSPGNLQGTLDEWLAKRAGAYQALVAWLDCDEYADFVIGFMQFCRTPGAALVDMRAAAGEEVTPFQVRHIAPTMLLSNFERVRSYEMWFEQADDVPVQTLHRLRIECKYLRYNLEFIGGLLGRESSEIIVLLRKLQDDLGDLNDAVVSKQLLSAGENSSDEKTVAHYEAAQEKIIDELSSETRDAFTRFIGKENRGRLLATIANI